MWRFPKGGLEDRVALGVGPPAVPHADPESNWTEYVLLHDPPQHHHHHGHGDRVPEITELGKFPIFGRKSITKEKPLQDQTQTYTSSIYLSYLVLLCEN